jgi:hypothetical protein
VTLRGTAQATWNASIDASDASSDAWNVSSDASNASFHAWNTPSDASIEASDVWNAPFHAWNASSDAWNDLFQRSSMPRFPEKEAEIVALASSIEGGLPSDPIFASPPVSPTQLAAAVSGFNDAASLAEQKRAEAAQATQAKADELAALVSQMKSVLDWAQKLPDVTEAQLRKIGWGFPTPPSGLQLPGQCRELEVASIAGSSVEFDWKKPTDGGRAATSCIAARRVVSERGFSRMPSSVSRTPATRSTIFHPAPGTLSWRRPTPQAKARFPTP